MGNLTLFENILLIVVATLFIAGLLELIEWAAKLVHLGINPIYLAAGSICGVLICVKLKAD
jgi:hypothetical protein